jgi:hypothetical protein
MARAYIVHARNDLSFNPTSGENQGLQILDLVPNTSLRNGALDGPGQTGYTPWTNLNDVVTLIGVGPIVTSGVSYGLRAYLVDRVENSGAAGDPALTAAQLATIATAILTRVEGGLPLTLTDINTAINLAAGVSGSDLNGTLGNSTGSVEDVLRILAGEVYRLPTASQVEDGANAFDATIRGAFVTRPNVLLPETRQTTNLAGNTFPVAGKNPFVGPVIPRSTAVQSGTQDTNFRDIRQIVDTGDLHRSVLDGSLEKLTSATFSWQSEGYTYGAAGTAATIAGTAINATTHAARALVVYDVAGNII